MRPILVFLAAVLACGQTSITTYHNDNAHTGRYLNEILLSPGNVDAAHFGFRDFLATDGPVYAQPLYLSRVKIPGKGLRNVLYVATSHDSLYAFDADDQFATQPLWRVNFLNAAKGVTTASAGDVGCVVLNELGITGTPVIDEATGTIYLIAETKEAGNKFVFRLHALDVTSGTERAGSPVEIKAPDFVPLSHKHRSSLLLSKGVVYSSWSGHCDLGRYHGFVMAHDAKSLKLLSVFNDTPGGSGASFWNGGAGPAADSDGNIYVVSANGYINNVPSPGGFDEAVLRITPAPGLSVVDTFTPFNKDTLNLHDYDLGSSGALLLPDEAGNAAHPHLLFTSGKEGRMFLLDRQALGGRQTATDSNALASLPVLSTATFGSSAYFNGMIYVAPEKSPMFAFPVSKAFLPASPAAQTNDTIGALGATPSISANGDSNGIVWVTTSDGGGKLRAYAADGLRKLYDSGEQSDTVQYTYTEFTAATIAGGRVFVPSYFGIAVYGELASNAPKVAAVTDGAAFSRDSLAPGSLISIFGTGLAAAPAAASSTPLPLSMADVSVIINGIPAPILFVSPKQINVQMPYGVGAGPASLIVRGLGAVSAPVAISLKPAAPALFTGANGQAAAINSDGSGNSAKNPARPGSYISIFFTGQGPVDSDLDDGEAPDDGTVIRATSETSATIGGVAAEVQFAGLAPGFPGVAQINLKVPVLKAGVYPVVVTVAGVASNTARVVVGGQ